MIKLEYIPDGSPDCPLMRLYGFGPEDAGSLQRDLSSLASGVEQSIALHERSYVEPIGGCSLVLVVCHKDRGILRRNSIQFECLLTDESWQSMAGLMEPFCHGARGYQWLDETGLVSLLLSPGGGW